MEGEAGELGKVVVDAKEYKRRTERARVTRMSKLPELPVGEATGISWLDWVAANMYGMGEPQPPAATGIQRAFLAYYRHHRNEFWRKYFMPAWLRHQHLVAPILVPKRRPGDGDEPVDEADTSAEDELLKGVGDGADSEDSSSGS